MVGFMHVTEKLIPNSIVLFPKANIISTAALISGELLFCLLLDMTPWYALTASIGWNSLELYFNHQRVSLEEMYEKVMSKSRGKRSSA